MAARCRLPSGFLTILTGDISMPLRVLTPCGMGGWVWPLMVEVVTEGRVRAGRSNAAACSHTVRVRTLGEGRSRWRTSKRNAPADTAPSRRAGHMPNTHVTLISRPGGHVELIPPRGPRVERDIWTDQIVAPELRSALTHIPPSLFAISKYSALRTISYMQPTLRNCGSMSLRSISNSSVSPGADADASTPIPESSS